MYPDFAGTLFYSLKATAVKSILLHAFSFKFAWRVMPIALTFEQIGQIFFLKLLLYISEVTDVVNVACVMGVS